MKLSTHQQNLSYFRYAVYAYTTDQNTWQKYLDLILRIDALEAN